MATYWGVASIDDLSDFSTTDFTNAFSQIGSSLNDISQAASSFGASGAGSSGGFSGGGGGGGGGGTG